MYKKTITYTDYNDEERTEDFYFNLTETEISMMDMETEGGLKDKLERIIAAKDAPELIKQFKAIILAAYGEKSADGKYFRKSPEISQNFTYSPAYDILFMEFATNSGFAAEFINGIIPKNLRVENPAQLPINS